MLNLWSLLQHAGSFSCSMQTLGCRLWPGIEAGPPALGVWGLNCWTAREVPTNISIWWIYIYIYIHTHTYTYICIYIYIIMSICISEFYEICGLHVQALKFLPFAVRTMEGGKLCEEALYSSGRSERSKVIPSARIHWQSHYPSVI